MAIYSLEYIWENRCVLPYWVISLYLNKFSLSQYQKGGCRGWPS